MKKELQAVPLPTGVIHIDTASIPAYVGEHLAQFALRDIQRAYADPEIQADYRRWKAARAAKNSKRVRS